MYKHPIIKHIIVDFGGSTRTDGFGVVQFGSISKRPSDVRVRRYRLTIEIRMSLLRRKNEFDQTDVRTV